MKPDVKYPAINAISLNFESGTHHFYNSLHVVSLTLADIYRNMLKTNEHETQF